MEKLTRKIAKEEIGKIGNMADKNKNQAEFALYHWFVFCCSQGYYVSKKEWKDVANIILTDQEKSPA